MFIQQAFKGVNHWWRYLIVTFLVLLGYQIGTLPLLMALWRIVDNDPLRDKSDIEAFMSSPDFDGFGINTNLGLTLMLLMFVAALTVFYFVFKPLHQREFKTLVRSTGSLDWNRIFFGFGLWLILTLIIEGVMFSISPEGYTWGFQLKTFIPLVILCIFVLPLQTSFEELFFRGYLMQGIGIMPWRKLIVVVVSALVTFFMKGSIHNMMGSVLGGDSHPAHGFVIMLTQILLLGILIFLGFQLLKSMGSEGHKIRNYKIVALVISSALFGLIHGSNPEIEQFGYGIMMIYYIGAGMLLGIMTLMDGRLELALGVHAATNFTGAVFVGYEGAALQTDSVLKSHELNPMFMTIGFFILAAIFLSVAGKKYGWGSYSQLLDPVKEPEEDLAISQLIKETATS